MNAISRVAERLAVSAAMIAVSATITHAADRLPSWNDGAAERSVVAFVDQVTSARADRIRAAGGAHRRVRQRRHALGRAADVFPARLRARSRQGAGAAASRMEDKGAVQIACCAGDLKAVRGRRREGHAEMITATHAGMTTDEFDEASATGSRPPTSHDKRPTPRWSINRCSSCSPTCGRTASRRSSSPGAASSSCGRGREGLWHSARAGRRQPRQTKVRDAGRQAGAAQAAGDRSHRRQGRQAGRIQTLIGRRPIAAFGNSDGDLQMLQWTAAGSGRAFLHVCPSHRRRARVGLRPHSPTSGSSTRVSMRRRRSSWTIVSVKDDWKRVFSFRK